ncbi:MAG: hypothetical protein ACRDTG_05330 [Pseudonocardiaceae bacterium]
MQKAQSLTKELSNSCNAFWALVTASTGLPNRSNRGTAVAGLPSHVLLAKLCRLARGSQLLAQSKFHGYQLRNTYPTNSTASTAPKIVFIKSASAALGTIQ